MSNSTYGPSNRLTQPELVLVLCAEPDLGVRIVHWLGQGSFEPVHVMDGYHASHLLQHDAIVAIITDRLLPPWPGIDVFSRLRKSRPDLAVIYIESGDVEYRQLARAAGATHVLSRPLRRQSVLDAISRGAAAA
jgi:DNA-binding response OmpR family regulator